MADITVELAPTEISVTMTVEPLEIVSNISAGGGQITTEFSTAPMGDRGEAGPQGVQGVKGDTGVTGADGPKGDTGDTGPKGDTGLQGETGLQGVQGVQGGIGLQGLKGDQGDTGLQGLKGDQGDVGPSSTFVQQTRPGANPPWSWWVTNASGEIINLIVNDGV